MPPKKAGPDPVSPKDSSALKPPVSQSTGATGSTPMALKTPKGLIITSAELPSLISHLFLMSSEHEFVSAVYSEGQLIGNLYRKGEERIFLGAILYDTAAHNKQAILNVLGKFPTCKKFYFLIDPTPRVNGIVNPSKDNDILIVDRTKNEAVVIESFSSSEPEYADFFKNLASYKPIFYRMDAPTQHIPAPPPIRTLWKILRSEISESFYETFDKLCSDEPRNLLALLTLDREKIPSADTRAALKFLSQIFARQSPLSIDALFQLDQHKAFEILSRLLLSSYFRKDPDHSKDSLDPKQGIIVRSQITGERIGLFSQIDNPMTEEEKQALRVNHKLHRIIDFTPQEQFSKAICDTLNELGLAITITDAEECVASLFEVRETSETTYFNTKIDYSDFMSLTFLCHSTKETPYKTALTREILTPTPFAIPELHSPEARKIRGYLKIHDEILRVDSMTLKLIAAGLFQLKGLSAKIDPSRTHLEFTQQLSRFDTINISLRHYPSLETFNTNFNAPKSTLKTGQHLCFFLNEHTSTLPYFIFCELGKLFIYGFEGEQDKLPQLRGSEIRIIEPSIDETPLNSFMTILNDLLSSEAVSQDTFARCDELPVSLYNLGVGLVKPLGICQKDTTLVRCYLQELETAPERAYTAHREVITACIKAGLPYYTIRNAEIDFAYAFQRPGSDEITLIIHPVGQDDEIGLKKEALAQALNAATEKTTGISTANTKLLIFLIGNPMQLAVIPPKKSSWKTANTVPGKTLAKIALDYIGIGTDETTGVCFTKKPAPLETTKSTLTLTLELVKDDSQKATSTATTVPRQSFFSFFQRLTSPKQKAAAAPPTPAITLTSRLTTPTNT